jgi:hypothetical protein
LLTARRWRLRTFRRRIWHAIGIATDLIQEEEFVADWDESLEQNEQDLGEMDDSDGESLPSEERKVFTQPVDLSVQTLVEQWTQKVLVLPEIQRQYVWDNGKASRLIESLLLKIPIPVLYFAETADAQFEIIDGHQRVRSIVRFMTNEFPLSGLGVLKELAGARFHELPGREQRFLNMRTLRAVIIGVESHPSMKFEIFERLNTGAISLNAQELRNSIYRGNLNRALRELVKSSDFRALIGTKVPRPRMVDEELVLRFFALSDKYPLYRPPLKRFLNNYLSGLKAADDVQIKALQRRFAIATSRVRTLFGAAAFRLINSSGHPLEKNVNRALFDAQMLACCWLQSDPTPEHAAAVLREFGRLCDDADFLDSVRRATGDRTRTRRRVRETIGAFILAGLEVDVPFDLAG